jgi:hypothetical protein
MKKNKKSPQKIFKKKQFLDIHIPDSVAVAQYYSIILRLERKI